MNHDQHLIFTKIFENQFWVILTRGVDEGNSMC